jgi:hypothetical protein
MPPGVYLHKRRSAEDRFWEKVARGSDDECWLWLAGKNSKGYGRFFTGEKPISAPRFVLTLMGHDMAGLETRHSCNNPSCVNPRHLSPGTSQDNTNDRLQTGRSSALRGERNGKTRLTEAIVREIRTRYEALPKNKAGQARKGTMKALAAEFGLSYAGLAGIVNGSRWSHI